MSGDGLAEEARAWVTLLLSGAATEADARALAGWRMTSVDHEAAFLDAARTYQLARTAIRMLEGESAVASRWSTARLQPSRRLLIGGGIAAAVGAAFVITNEPGRLLGGSSEELSTAKGERRTFDLAEGVSVELNTLTRVALREDLGRGGFELLRGEALVDIQAGGGPVQIAAGAARVESARGRLSLRNLAGDLSAACLEGGAEILLEGRKAILSPGQAIRWGAGALGPVTHLAQASTSEWWRGVLVFDDERLGDVIAELNRYRRGRIVVANPAIAARRVSGAFYIDRLDEVVEQLRLAYGVRIMRMPGDVVIVS